MNPVPQSAACVSYNLRKASRIVSKVYSKEMRLAPVRGPQYSLMMITRLESPAVSELAERTGADRTTMTRNLGHLEKRGFIRIAQGKDIRSKAVELTPKGKAALNVRFRIGAEHRRRLWSFWARTGGTECWPTFPSSLRSPPSSSSNCRKVPYPTVDAPDTCRYTCSTQPAGMNITGCLAGRRIVDWKQNLSKRNHRLQRSEHLKHRTRAIRS